MPLVRQQHGGRNGDAEFGGQRIVEELVVGAPPEGIVDDLGSREHGVLEIRAIEGNIVRDAVDDDGVAGGLRHLDAARLEMLGRHAGDSHRVDAIHQGGWKRLFHAIEYADFLHIRSHLLTRKTFAAI